MAQQRRSSGGASGQGGGRGGGAINMHLDIDGPRNSAVITVALTKGNKPVTDQQTVTFRVGTEEHPYREFLRDPENPGQLFALYTQEGSGFAQETMDFSGFDSGKFTHLVAVCDGCRNMAVELPKEVKILEWQKRDAKQSKHVSVEAERDEDKQGRFRVKIVTKDSSGEPARRNLRLQSSESMDVEFLTEKGTIDSTRAGKRIDLQTPSGNLTGVLEIRISFSNKEKLHPTLTDTESGERHFIDLVKSPEGGLL